MALADTAIGAALYRIFESIGRIGNVVIATLQQRTAFAGRVMIPSGELRGWIINCEAFAFAFAFTF